MTNKAEASLNVEIEKGEDKKEGKSFLFEYVEKIKTLLQLDELKKEKLKKFLTSNVGITSIVILVATFFVGINVATHHHGKQIISTINDDWGSQVVRNEKQLKSKPQIAIAKEINTKPTQSIATNPDENKKIKEIMVSLSDLQEQMKTLNQRMMLVSQEFLSEKNKKTINSNYQVLGWRLDQETNQWIADIDYQGQVKAYYAGQRFGQWVVYNVSANGVQIKELA